jgi:hypothetical protein
MEAQAWLLFYTLRTALLGFAFGIFLYNTDKLILFTKCLSFGCAHAEAKQLKILLSWSTW